MFLFVAFLAGCAHEEPIPEQVISRSISAHGGWETYQQLKSIDFTKTTILYDSLGNVASRTDQEQNFQFVPERSISVRWRKDQDTILVALRHGKVDKLVNDSAVVNEKELTKAGNLINAAEYVVFQPFLLKDTNATFTYLGKRTINGRKTEAIGVNYGELKDPWVYYFDTCDHKLVGAQVTHNGNISLIENVSFDGTTGLLLNAHRKSYFIDDANNKKYLKAEYFYKAFAAK